MNTNKIGFTTATAIVVANMIGTGVFTSLGFQVMGIQTTFALLMLWLVGGLIALTGALSYSELGAAIPKSGGEYAYLSRIYHPALGFLSGWISLIVGFAAPIALAAMAFSRYLTTVLPQLNELFVGTAVVLLITYIHSTSISLGGKFQNVLTLIKVLLIVLFIVCGFLLGDPQITNILPHANSFNEIWSSEFAISLIFVSYAYSGWNASSYIADEIKDPQKNIPFSLLVGTSMVIILYVLLNFIFLYTVPISEMMDTQGNPIVEIGAVSAIKIFGDTGGQLMSLVIALLLVSTISSMVFAGPRVASAIGSDIPLLRHFAQKNENGIPTVAIYFQSFIAMILILTSSFDAVLTYLGFILSLFSTITVIGVFVLRHKEPALSRPFKAWAYPFTPIIYVGLNLWILWFVISDRPLESLIGLATVIIGFLFYLLTKKYLLN
jgi:APA family basic amino acid/polyamine antiporter